MAGAMRKMAVYLGLVEDDRYDDYDEYDDEGSAPEPERTPLRREESGARGVRAGRDEHATLAALPDRRVDRLTDRHLDRLAPRPGVPAPVGPTEYRITTIHPRTYNEAKTIGEAFRSDTPVIMNLTDMDDADAKRLVDFAAGLIFGLHGSIERVTNKVFLLSPANVSVTAEEKARIAENGFFNQS